MECLTGNLVLKRNIKTSAITRSVTFPSDIMNFSAISRDNISRCYNIINDVRHDGR